jgi:hypothetical protein
MGGVQNFQQPAPQANKYSALDALSSQYQQPMQHFNPMMGGYQA